MFEPRHHRAAIVASRAADRRLIDNDDRLRAFVAVQTTSVFAALLPFQP
jgi:hypothetical protein